MAIVIEDGTQVAGANSYVTEAELTAYATARGITLTGTAEPLLIQAMDYIESRRFKGDKMTKAQPLQWPRSGVYVDGYLIENDEIPGKLKSAQLALAVAIDAGNNPLATSTQAVKREKVDVIEVEYQDGTSSSPYIASVQAYLSDLIIPGSGFGTATVTRA